MEYKLGKVYVYSETDEMKCLGLNNISISQDAKELIGLLKINFE